MAPGVGFEPTTNWLTANCSTVELPGKMTNNFLLSKINAYATKKKYNQTYFFFSKTIYPLLNTPRTYTLLLKRRMNSRHTSVHNLFNNRPKQPYVRTDLSFQELLLQSGEYARALRQTLGLPPQGYARRHHPIQTAW